MFKFRKIFQSYVWNIVSNCVAETSVIFGLLGIYPRFTNNTLQFYLIEPSFCSPQAMWLGVANLLSDSRKFQVLANQSHKIIVSGIGLWHKPQVTSVSGLVKWTYGHTEMILIPFIMAWEMPAWEFRQYKGRGSARWRVTKSWCHTLQHMSEAVPHLDFSMMWNNKFLSLLQLCLWWCSVIYSRKSSD